MSLLSKSVLLGLASTGLAQEAASEEPALRTYVTSFGDTGDNDNPVWEMEFEAHDDEEAQKIAEENSIEALMMKDDLGQMLLQLEQVLEQRQSSLARRGGEMSEGDLESLNQLRRFKNLKAMVMSMQPPESVFVFGRYCYYGCWCLPQGQHNLASGYGQPIDPVDAVCKEFSLCYKCIDIDFGGSCNPEKRGYKWGKSYDSAGVQIDIRCKNNHNNGPSHRCARFVCECDRILAVGLKHVWMHWERRYHARWTTLKPNDTDYWSKEDGCATISGDYRQDACCGSYGAATHDVHQMSNAHTGNYPIKPYSRRPYATTNPNNGCCQDAAIFDTANQECCILPDDTHAIHHDKHYKNGTLIDASQFGINSGENRWFGADGPDNDAIGDLDTNPDVQVTPIGGCSSLGGSVVPQDGVADWGTNYYQKK
jgi:hypothetical protein